jgi:hypothetical protein
VNRFVAVGLVIGVGFGALVASGCSTSTPVQMAPAVPAVAMSNELQIESVIVEFRRRFWEQIVNRTFDVAALNELTSGEQTDANRLAFDLQSAGTKYSKPGKIQRVVVIKTEIQGDVATVISCEQNDIRVWDGKGTEDTSDDLLLDDSVTQRQLQYSMQKIGESWKISGSLFGGEADCSSVFN